MPINVDLGPLFRALSSKWTKLEKQPVYDQNYAVDASGLAQPQTFNYSPRSKTMDILFNEGRSSDLANQYNYMQAASAADLQNKLAYARGVDPLQRGQATHANRLELNTINRKAQLEKDEADRATLRELLKALGLAPTDENIADFNSLAELRMQAARVGDETKLNQGLGDREMSEINLGALLEGRPDIVAGLMGQYKLGNINTQNAIGAATDQGNRRNLLNEAENARLQQSIAGSQFGTKYPGMVNLSPGQKAFGFTPQGGVDQLAEVEGGGGMGIQDILIQQMMQNNPGLLRSMFPQSKSLPPPPSGSAGLAPQGVVPQGFSPQQEQLPPGYVRGPSGQLHFYQPNR